MAGNRIGGLKAAQRNLEKDPDFYKRIGSVGGTKSGTGGFYYAKLHKSPDDPSHPKASGIKGGHISKRGKSKKVVTA